MWAHIFEQKNLNYDPIPAYGLIHHWKIFINVHWEIKESVKKEMLSKTRWMENLQPCQIPSLLNSYAAANSPGC